MKITFPKQEIEKFLSLCSYLDITNDSISYSPITEYILVELKRGFCKMTLTSQSSFISYMFSISDQSSEVFLVSYLKLQSYYENKRGETLILTLDGEKTVFYDGIFTSKYVKSSEIKIELFPKTPSISGKSSTQLDKVLINILNVSKKYIKPENKDRLLPFLNHSNIQGNILLSSDAFISFYYTLNAEYEFTSFSKSEIDLMSNFDSIEYFKLDGWNILKHKTIIFGKRIVEGLVPLLYPKLKEYVSILKKDCVMKIPVELFFNFCKSIKRKEKDSTVNSYLEIVESGIKLSYEDIKNNIDDHQIINCSINGYEIGYKFPIMHSSILKVLDSLNAETINLSECVETSGRKGYIGFWLDSDVNYYSICSKGFEAPSENPIQENSF